MSYVSRAGTLLTVDEAAQWVLHAAQLPQEVADAFVNNMVTGYDFPELAARQVRYRGIEGGQGGWRCGGEQDGTTMVGSQRRYMSHLLYTDGGQLQQRLQQHCVEAVDV